MKSSSSQRSGPDQRRAPRYWHIKYTVCAKNAGTCSLDVAPKALLKVVRCNCKMGCDTLRCSCRKAGLDCSTGCGECRGGCANMYGNITEDSEYDDETLVVILLMPYDIMFLYIALIGTIGW